MAITVRHRICIGDAKDECTHKEFPLEVCDEETNIHSSDSKSLS